MDGALPQTTILNWLLGLALAGAAAAAVVHALLFKRDSRAALGWVAVSVLFPAVGPVLYFLFGINRIRSRAQRLGVSVVPGGHETGVTALGPRPEGVTDPVAVASARLARFPLRPVDRLEALPDTTAVFEHMLGAIGEARERVWLSTYIFDADALGRRFAGALTEAARRGVDVRVLVDGVGEWYGWPRISRLLRRPVQVAVFLPPRLWPPSLRINLRTHRKFLVVDDHRAYVGGMNVSARHLPRPEGKDVDDAHFLVEGPVVRDFETVFLEQWCFAADAPFEQPETGETRGAGASAPLCRLVTDGPDQDLDRLIALLAAAIGSARERVGIMTPYFLPPRELISALQAAAARGVEVTVVLPVRSNLRYVDWATRHMLWELLVRDVRVHAARPPFSHAKLFAVDGRYAQIGSANWDARSLRLNYEIALEVFDERFAAAIEARMARQLEGAEPITLETLGRRSLPARLRDAACWLFTPYL